MKSVLRELGHLAAFPTIAMWGHPDDDQSAKGLRIAAARESRAQRASAEARVAIDPTLKGYLLGRQHDAWIQSFRREGDRLTITAYDDDLAELAATVYKAPAHEVEMPFDLVLESVVYVGWRRVGDGGRLTFASAPRRTVEWIDDEILPGKGAGVQWGLLYHVCGETERESGQHLLLVEAASLHVVERQRGVWRAQFGASALAVYDAYAPLRPELPLNHGEKGAAWMRALAESHTMAGE